MSNSSLPPPLVDPFTPPGWDEPYDSYAWLRANRPCFWHVQRGAFCLTRYADVEQALRQPTRFTSAMGIGANARPSPMMSMTDGADHQRLRGVAARFFTPRHVADYRPWLDGLGEELVAAFYQRGSGCLVRDIAEPLVNALVRRVVGLPDEWAPDVAPGAASILADISGVERQESTREVRRTFIGRLRAHVLEGTALYGMSEVARQAQTSGEITIEEATSFLVLLVVAGYETTVNSLVNVLQTLLSDRERWTQAPEFPLVQVIDECLRWSSPDQSFFRTTTEEMTIHGVSLPAGARVLLSLGSANRDPERFVDGERVVLGRKEKTSLAFGAGPHYCMGAPLARITLQSVLDAVRRRPSTLVLDPGAVRAANVITRGFSSLPAHAES
jgi:cytochrome P450